MKKAFVLASALLFSAAVLPAWALDDISGHEYEQMINFLNEEGIISGYPDATFKPDNPVNRVEFLRVVLESSQESIPEAEGDCGFNDVEAGAWYTKYVCKAAELEIVAGYPDGSFKPSQQVTFVEAAKIAVLGYDFELADFAEDIEWYVPYVSMASDNLLIPPDVDKLDKPLTRGQISEFLGRSVKYKEGDLVDYLEGMEMDYVLFDMDEFVLGVVDALSDDIEQLLEDLTSDIDVDTGDVDWIVNSDGVLGEDILYGSDDLSGYYGVTAENPGVLTGEVVGGSEDGNYFKIDLKPQETGLTFDYSGDDGTVALSSWIDGVISLEADDGSTSALPENALPEGTNYTQSLTATWPNSEIIYSAGKDSFGEHIVNEVGPVLYISDLGDGVYSESLKINDEGLDFTYESEDKDGNGILKNSEDWIYVDPYGTYLISQTIEDDYYYELFILNLGDSTMELVYSDDNYYENFGLEDDSVGMGLAISMSGGDASETFVYDDGELSVGVSIDDIGTTDLTTNLASDSDSVVVSIVNNEVSAIDYTVTDGNAQMVVTYDNYGEGYEAMDGILYTEGFAHNIFDDGFVSTEVAMGEFGFEGDKIMVSTEGISLNSDFGTLEAPIAICDETGSWVLGEGKLTWKKMMEDYLAGQAKKAEGSFDWGKGGYISGFDVDLDLGDDEEEVDEASADGEDFKWNKKMKLSLNPFSSSYDGTILGPNLVGEQSGKVKGRGLNKWWKLGLGLDIDLDLDSGGGGASASVKPKAEQDFTYTNGKFKKDHSSYTNALTWEIMQKFGADWVIGGANVKKENTTSLINGVLNGEQEININAGDFGKEMVSEYGTGKLFRVGQEVDFNLPGQGKKSITVTAGSNNRLGYEQTMSWPLDGDSIFGPGSGWSGGVSGWGGYDGHIWRGGAGLTGQHSSGFTVDVSVEKGEGGKPTVSVGFGWKF